METPSSMRRTKQERPANAERSALLDITNDSPIVGLALSSSVPSEKTPSSSAAAKRRVSAPAKKAGTPGSGEALLRGQVRTLLQKVEEEEKGEMAVSRPLSGEPRPAYRVLLDLPGPSPSPVQIFAPTPANTPQIAGLSSAAVSPMDAVEEVCVKIDTPQAGLKEEEEEPQSAPECLINRALLFDSPGKSEASDCAASSAISSSLTYQDSEIVCEKSPDDDGSSAWSLQVNTSSHNNDEEEENEEEEEYEEEECFDELCEGLSKMSMNSEKAGGLPEFTGTHTRFVYSNDDDEEVIEREEVVVKEEGIMISPSAVLLKGLPVPEGKHLRFHDEEEEYE